jgi:hypothetical protein
VARARAGSAAALETLLRYCLEDVVNLKPLLALAYNRLAARLPFAIAPIEDDARPPIARTADPAGARPDAGAHGRKAAAVTSRSPVVGVRRAAGAGARAAAGDAAPPIKLRALRT